MRVQVQYFEKEYKAFALRVLKMGEPLVGLDPSGYDSGDDDNIIDGYKPDVWPVPLAYDSKEPAGVFACYLQNPCSVWHGMPTGYQLTQATPNPASPAYENEVPPNKDAGSPGDASESEQGLALFNAQGSLVAIPLPEDESQTTQNLEFYDFPYSFIELTQRYIGNNGWVSLPLAQTSTTANRSASLIQMHAPVAKRILTMTATRNGRMPIIPSMKEVQLDHNGNREVLDDWDITLKAPELGADGTARNFSIQVMYVYLLEKAPGPTDKLRGASSPLDLFSPDKHWLDLARDSDTDGQLQWEFGTTVTYSGG